MGRKNKMISKRDLETIYETGYPAEIYRDEVSDEVLFGYINSLKTESDEFTKLVCITSLCSEKSYNGLSLVYLEHITRVRFAVDQEGISENRLFTDSKFPRVPEFRMLSIRPALSQLQTLFGCLTVYVKCQRGEVGVTGELLSDRFDPVTIRELPYPRPAQQPQEASLGESFRFSRAIVCVHSPTWVLDTERITRIDADGILERTVAGL
jgi:hypothetical protein